MHATWCKSNGCMYSKAHKNDVKMLNTCGRSLQRAQIFFHMGGGGFMVRGDNFMGLCIPFGGSSQVLLRCCRQAVCSSCGFILLAWE